MVDHICRFFLVLGEENLTQAQEKCLDLEIQATCILHRSLSDKIFGETMYMKTAHDIWLYLNLIYEGSLMMMMMSPRRRYDMHTCMEHVTAACMA